MVTIEVCAANLQSVLAARDGGAHRIELCSALDTGGLTPSPGLIHAAVRAAEMPVCALIRPREGNFVFSADEVRIMADDIAFCRENGVHGVVIGALTEARHLDIEALKTMAAAAGNLELVFHRAFDFVQNPDEALETLIDLGFSRILSSGQEKSAWDGREQLAHWVNLAANRITIMPGSGIHAHNIVDLWRFTGASAFHLSARHKIEQPTEHEVPGLETGYFASHVDTIKAVVHAVHAL